MKFYAARGADYIFAGMVVVAKLIYTTLTIVR